jgi:predicted HicB family RNase H-like nuclease
MKGASRRSPMEKYVVIAVPTDLHTEVKARAALQEKTLKQFVIDALRAAVKEGGRKGKK